MTAAQSSIDWAAEHARIRAEQAARVPSGRGSPERSVQVTLKQYLERVLPGCEVVAIKNEHVSTGSTKEARMRFYQKRKAEGVKTGAPDLMVLHGVGLVFFVECKAPGGEVRASQSELHARWAPRGYVVIIADGIESLRLGLHQAGIRTLDGGGPMHAPRVRYQKRVSIDNRLPI